MAFPLGDLAEVGQVGVQRGQSRGRGGAVSRGARQLRLLGRDGLDAGPETPDALVAERRMHAVHDQALDGDVALGEALGEERRLLDGVAARRADDHEAAGRLGE